MSLLRRACQRALPFAALSNDLTVLELNEAAREAVREAEGRKCFEVAGRRKACPRCPAKRALEEGKPTGALVTTCMVPGRWLLEALPVEDGRGVVLAFHRAGLEEVLTLADRVGKFERLVERGMKVLSSFSESRDFEALILSLPKHAVELIESEGACLLVRSAQGDTFTVASSTEPSIWGLHFAASELSPLLGAVEGQGGLATFEARSLPPLPGLLEKVTRGKNLVAAEVREVGGLLLLWRRTPPFDPNAPLTTFFVKMADVLLRSKQQAVELVGKTVTLERQLKLAELLHRIDRVALLPHSTKEKLAMLASTLGTFGIADVCAVVLFKDGKFKVEHAYSREGPVRARRRAFHMPELEPLLSGASPLVIPDANSHQIGSVLLQALGLRAMRSLLVLPVHARQALKGFVVWGSRAPAAFDAEAMRHATLISAQVNMAFETAELQREVSATFASAVEAFSTAIDAKSKWTSGHSRRVAVISSAIGEVLGLPGHDVETLVVGALLHDVGKIYIPTEILEKPGKLTEREWKEMRRHPVLSGKILLGSKWETEWAARIPIPEGAPLLIGLRERLDRPMARFAPIAKWHHENWDGTGYPEGLKGEEIPLLARVVRVADSLEAMTANRPYRKALPLARAVEEIEEGKGKQYDPEVTEAVLAAYTRGLLKDILRGG